MFEHTYWTFWFYKTDTKSIGLSFTNRGPKLSFETRSTESIEDESEVADESSVHAKE